MLRPPSLVRGPRPFVTLFLGLKVLETFTQRSNFGGCLFFFCCLFLGDKKCKMSCTKKKEGWIMALPLGASAEVLFPEGVLSVDGVLLN